MATKSKEQKILKPEAEEPKAPKDPLIKTLDEVSKMSREEQDKFRMAGGTTISNPQ